MSVLELEGGVHLCLLEALGLSLLVVASHAQDARCSENQADEHNESQGAEEPSHQILHLLIVYLLLLSSVISHL